MGLEASAAVFAEVPDWNAELVHQQELDELRNYVRWDKGQDWPLSYRAIYPVNALFFDKVSKEAYDVPHEYKVLRTEWNEYFFVIAIFGVEFAINMGGRETSGYRKWLSLNKFESPLYPGNKYPPRIV